MKLSIVTTMYWSEIYIEEFYQRCKTEVQKITEGDYEIIFVNDGSPDNSLQKATELAKHDECITIIDLSKNFGHHKAIMAGLSYSSGDLVFLIDCDLEEDPEWLGGFYEELSAADDLDVVYGVQEKRKGGIIERITGEVFYYLLNILSDADMPANVTTARLMTRRYVNNLLLFQEQELFLGGVCHYTGFNQKPIVIFKHSSSISTYDLSRKLSLLVNAITSFSNKPLKLIFNTGLLVTFLSLIAILYLVFSKLFFKQIVSGWTSIIVSVWFLGGLIITFLGTIGLYISTIFTETKNRPNTIVKDIINNNSNKEV